MPRLFRRPLTPIEFICATDHVVRHHDQLVRQLSPHAAAPPAEPRAGVRCRRPWSVAADRHRIPVSEAPFWTLMARQAVMAGFLVMKATSAATRPCGNTSLIARLLEQLPRLLVPYGRWLQLDEASPETVVSHHGAVEIRQTHATFSVQTCVKGEPDRARTTALQRLANYLAGNNRSGTRLRAAGPLVQREEAPGRWLVSVALPSVEDACVAAVSRNGKVRIRPTRPELHAVLRMYGRPTPKAMARGDAAIRAALAGSLWAPAGGPAIRLHRLPAILPFTYRFEVALPIARQHYYAPCLREACGDIIQYSAAQERATHPSLPVHVVTC